ncbi:MAG: glycosyltransferase, partial [Eubacterium sp.]|nr:glycosyltransferase [Eubacterium sp.]
SHKFDIVHSHVIFFSGFVLMAAAKNGVKVRASHSHTVRWNRKENLPYRLYTTVMRFVLKRYSNLKFACSNQSGRFLYGDKEYSNNGIIIPNGIDTARFSYNEEYRNEIRREFSIAENELLVGHVGTVYEIKNQTFLVKVFSEIVKRKPDAILMLVGQIVDDGPVKKVIDECGLNEKVIFTGSRSDIYKFYQAFDIMVFQSLFEALPVSLIEAQASKLPCLISDAVTTDVKYNDNVSFLSLSRTPSEWADTALKLLQCKRTEIDNRQLVSVYEISNVIKLLEKYYSM